LFFRKNQSFSAKNVLPSKQFETSMNIETTIVKTICNFGHAFFKQAILAMLYQDFGHKLGKISGNPDFVPRLEYFTIFRDFLGIFRNV